MGCAPLCRTPKSMRTPAGSGSPGVEGPNRLAWEAGWEDRSLSVKDPVPRQESGCHLRTLNRQ